MTITSVTGSGTAALTIVTSTTLAASDWVLLKYSGTNTTNDLRDTLNNVLSADDPLSGDSALGSSASNTIDLSNVATFAATGGYDLVGLGGNILIGSAARDNFDGAPVRT